MQTKKILNIIAGIAGIASLAMPTLGFFRYELVYWMFGIFGDEGEVEFLFRYVHEEGMVIASLTIVAGILIAAAAIMFLLSLIPKLDMSLFTLLGWIIGLTGCGVFLIFGFGADIDGPLLLVDTVYPIGLVASFASGGLGLVSWILQPRVKKPFARSPTPGKVQEVLYRRQFEPNEQP